MVDQTNSDSEYNVYGEDNEFEVRELTPEELELIDEVLVSIDDSGALSSSTRLREILEPVMYLRNAHPRVGFFCGWLGALELLQLFNAS